MKTTTAIPAATKVPTRDGFPCAGAGWGGGWM